MANNWSEGTTFCLGSAVDDLAGYSGGIEAKLIAQVHFKCTEAICHEIARLNETHERIVDALCGIKEMIRPARVT